MFYVRLMVTALRSLDVHFLRSLLATLGVLIGVGSVVACMSIIEGATGNILRSMKSFGSNLIFVTPETARIQGRRVGIAQTLVVEDMYALQRKLEDRVVGIAPIAIGSGVPIKHFQKSDTFTVIATTEKYFDLNDYLPHFGRSISNTDAQDEMARVTCLGSKVAEKLFAGGDAVGQAVRIRNGVYRVIGVMEAQGNIGFLDVDNSVFIPLRSGLRRFFNRRWLNLLTVHAAEKQDLVKLRKQIQAAMRRQHHIRLGQPDDFDVATLEEAVRDFSQATMIFKVVFYSIAGISLVVGGIGIMNIMLVSVTERTREIGVRMAVGARRGDILLQFLIEALIISLVGGGFGLLFGAMVADLLDKVLQGMFSTEITGGVVVTALLTTTAVGIISGLYPAFKASRLDPVEALRYE